MRDPITQSRRLQLTLKITAISCGCILLVASAHSESGALNFDIFLKFAASQVQSSNQLQWLFGVIFLSAGIFFAPIKAGKQRSFGGPKELTNDSYVLYLLDQYQIEKNLVLDQLIVRDKIFSNIHDALAFVHEIECPPEISAPFSSPKAVDEPTISVEEEKSRSPHQAESDVGVLTNPFLNARSLPASAEAEIWDEAKRRKVIIIAGTILFSTVLSGLYYANSHSFKSLPQPVATIKTTSALPETPNSDQVASGPIPITEASSAVEVKEVGKTVAIPINDRWIGLWVAEGGGKQKLLVTANLLKLNDEEFNWVGTRPKGIVQCCLAFYEGAITKADLLARISGAQDPGVTLKAEAQKTLTLVNGLSEGNFKRIVFADPFLKKYFFIYDQNYVYRISRDLGDKVDVVIEPFKKQE